MRHFGPESFTLLPPGQFAWVGVLLDPANLNAEQEHSVVAFLSSNDDSILERDLTASLLQNLAYEYGFRQCEVQNYLHETSDSYETVFRDPLQDQITAVA